MSKPQIKTIETRLIAALKKSSQESKLAQIFLQVRETCTDNDFLERANLRETVFDYIYVKNVYRIKTVEGLRQIIHLDNKTLLTIRKNFLHLFAKKYFGETNLTENLLMLFYAELI